MSVCNKDITEGQVSTRATVEIIDKLYSRVGKHTPLNRDDIP